MLVLSRRRDEAVVVGEGDSAVTVTVLEIRGDRVRLGFAGKVHVPIFRSEVVEAGQQDHFRKEGTNAQG